MSDTVIQVDNLSKKYRLGVINRKMLVDQLESWIYRKLGKPDPHASVFDHATDRMPTPYDFWALKDVSFSIQCGDIVGIMGRNGSGKSTLLKLLSRITSPTTGVARIKGRVASLLEVGTGFNYELTGKENVYLKGSIMGLKQTEIDDRYKNITDFAEIPDFMDTPVKRYSSGMRVRLAFAVAAHLEPEILILDEVLAVGDAKFQEKCLNRIDEIKDSGVTILFVSHSSQSVLKLCTKGLLLEEGRLVAQGTANEVTSRYLESLHLEGEGRKSELGVSGSRAGRYAGKVAAFLMEKLPKGSLSIGDPVETQEGVLISDVSWASDARLKTVRTEPTWSAAPDVCVSIVSASKPSAIAEFNTHHFLRSGATEAWIVRGDGSVKRFKNQHSQFIVSDPPERLDLI